MSYININEVDKTSVNTVQINSDNVVYIPGNASDGPSDEYVLLGSYQDFISTFGDDPEPDGNAGSSWDYAACMLKAGFPVLFRRITHYIDKYGNNIQEVTDSDGELQEKTGLLPDVATSECIIQTEIAAKKSTTETDSAGSDIEIGIPPGETVGTPEIIPMSTTTTETENTDSAIVNLVDKIGSKDVANMFILNYRYPGTTGNSLVATLNMVKGNGLYLRVYKGTSILANIMLVNFRYYETNDAKRLIRSYDINTEEGLKEIWRLLMKSFGITVNGDNVTFDSNDNEPIDIKNDYITISLNPNLKDVSGEFGGYTYTEGNKRILQGILKTSNSKQFPFKGGANPGTDCVASQIANTYYPLKDKYVYDIKFVTSGGYTDSLESGDKEIETAMIDLADSRLDCIAFPDIPLHLAETEVPTYFSAVTSSYAAAYAPWVKMALPTRKIKWMPPSFVFLYKLAQSVVTNGNRVYYPPAGIRRATIAEARGLSFPVSSAYLETWQDGNPQSINPIINLNRYGTVIFGQKTLYNVVTGMSTTKSALQDLNVRLTANEIKKAIFRAALELTFEYNNIHTWNEFTARVTPILNQMKSDGAVTYYNIVMDSSTMTTADIESNRIVGTVSVIIARAAENFDITFELLPNQVEYLYDDTTESELIYTTTTTGTTI